MKFTILNFICLSAMMMAAEAAPATNAVTAPIPAASTSSTVIAPPVPNLGTGQSASSSKAVMPLTPNSITPQEWQELNAARVAAFKANPELQQKAAELAAKMRTLQQKVDAEVVKLDPSTAPVVASIERSTASKPSSSLPPTGHSATPVIPSTSASSLH